MDARLKEQLISKLESLGDDPGAAHGVKPMSGQWAGHCRLRHGDLRVIYFWDRPADTVVISHIGPRGDIYK